MTEQIVIAILVLLVLVLGYYVWIYRSTCVLVTGALGQELDELEVLLQDVKVEHFQDTSKDSNLKISNKIQSRRDRIEERLQKIQALRAAGKLKLDAKQEARLRRAVAEGNDYLATTYSGQDEDSVKLVRRIRDMMLWFIKNTKMFRRINCGSLMYWRKEKSRYKGLVNSMNWSGGYGHLAMLDTILPELQKLSDDDVAKAPERFFSDPKSMDPEEPAPISLAGHPTLPPDSPPIPEAQPIEPTADDEKRLLLQLYWTLNNAICGSGVKNILGDARRGVNYFKELARRMEAEVTDNEILNVIDGMEQLLLHVQKKLCPDGKLDRKKIYEVYQRMIALMCDNDDFAMSLISQPLDVAITKSLSLFE